MSKIAACLVALSLISCATTTPGACQNPVQDACSTKANESSVSAELAREAAARHTTTEELTSEFMNACEGQLSSDLDQVLIDLKSITTADGGTAP